MRTIVKSEEPASLAQHRLTPHASYGNLSKENSDELRTALVSEQRGLCCYCLRHIQPQGDVMKIEHWHSRSRYSAEQLVYSNLLGACLGNKGQRLQLQHCDARKGRRDLSRNPADSMPRIEDMVRFAGDGRISSDNPSFDSELNEILNLNEAFLKNSRKAVLDAFRESLVKRGHLPRATLSRWVEDWNGELHAGELREFCQIVVYWLRKKLVRA